MILSPGSTRAYISGLLHVDGVGGGIQLFLKFGLLAMSVSVSTCQYFVQILNHLWYQINWHSELELSLVVTRTRAFGLKSSVMLAFALPFA